MLATLFSFSQIALPQYLSSEKQELKARKADQAQGIIPSSPAMAAPFWKDIEHYKERGEKELYETAKMIRMIYAPAMLNGPFAMLFAFKDGVIGFNDRIKLRPFVAAVNGDTVYMASEESAIRVICPEPEKVWMPKAGEPVIALLKHCNESSACHPT
jgi:glutamate synthase domain-containing protein 1